MHFALFYLCFLIMTFLQKERPRAVFENYDPPKGPNEPPKCPKDTPRGAIWRRKWAKGRAQSAKWTPVGAPGAALGSLWELWVTFGVILDTSGRQRGHFSCKAPELRKTKDSNGKT